MAPVMGGCCREQLIGGCPQNNSGKIASAASCKPHGSEVYATKYMLCPTQQVCLCLLAIMPLKIAINKNTGPVPHDRWAVSKPGRFLPLRPGHQEDPVRHGWFH